MMGARLLGILKGGAVLLAVSTITLLAIRAYDSQRGKPLEPWHTHVPHELSVKELDQADWAEYLTGRGCGLRECARRGNSGVGSRRPHPHQSLF